MGLVPGEVLLRLLVELQLKDSLCGPLVEIHHLGRGGVAVDLGQERLLGLVRQCHSSHLCIWGGAEQQATLVGNLRRPNGIGMGMGIGKNDGRGN